MENPSTGRVVIFSGAGKSFETVIKPIRPLEHGEILVRITHTNLCYSDIHTYSGRRQEKTPTVLGHEMIGEVVAHRLTSPAIDYAGLEIKQGDMITWCVYANTNGPSGSLLPQKQADVFKYGHEIANDDCFHGGLAEYCILRNYTAVFVLPQTVKAATAALLNCSLATASAAIKAGFPVKDKRILIAGLGALGLACSALAHDKGAKEIVACEINPERRCLSQEFGVSLVFRSMKEIANRGFDFDLFIDTSGVSEVMETGISLLTKGGTAIFVGAVYPDREISLIPEKIVRNVLTIKGIHNYHPDDLGDAVDFLCRYDNEYPFDRIVERTLPIERVEEAFELAIQQSPCRVGVSPFSRDEDLSPS